MRRLRWHHVALAMLVVLGESEGSRMTPQAEIGVPAGLIPNCPGVLKNVSISPQRMQQFKIVNYWVSETGQIMKRFLPIASAAKQLLKDKHLDLNRKTVVITNGYWETSQLPHNIALAKTYVRKGYNVFGIETFSFLSYIYPKAVRLSRVLGKKVGEFVAKLVENGLDNKNLELVGLSLGAHVAGITAKTVYALTGKKASRITGLDPAGPCFRTLPSEYKLWHTDAEKVDVLHTNIDGFGMAEPLGHIDFYLNGGEYQPGDIPYIPCLIICSHLRSIIYWWIALDHPKKFIGIKCDSIQDARFANCYNNTDINYLGLETNFNKRGIYYLATNNEFPYFRGKDGLKVENEIYSEVASRINEDDNFTVDK